MLFTFLGRLVQESTGGVLVNNLFEVSVQVFVHFVKESVVVLLAYHLAQSHVRHCLVEHLGGHIFAVADVGQYHIYGVRNRVVPALRPFHFLQFGGVVAGNIVNVLYDVDGSIELFTDFLHRLALGFRGGNGGVSLAQLLRSAIEGGGIGVRIGFVFSRL